jgi:hypothetical protein
MMDKSLKISLSKSMKLDKSLKISLSKSVKLKNSDFLKSREKKKRYHSSELSALGSGISVSSVYNNSRA